MMTGNQLASLCGTLCLTVEQFAWLLGVSPVTCYRWFNESRNTLRISGGTKHVLALLVECAPDPELVGHIEREDALGAFRLLTLQMQKSA